MKQLVARLVLVFCLLANAAYAANEIQFEQPSLTGQTLYFTLFSGANHAEVGEAWDGDSWEPYTTTRATWDIVMTEVGTTGYFRGSLPAAATGELCWRIWQDANDDATPDHATDLLLAEGYGTWSGTILGDDGGGGGGGDSIITASAVAENTTNVSIYVLIIDSATGLPASGLTHSNITSSYYARSGATSVEITPLATHTAITDPHADGKIKEQPNMPGVYRFDPPDAAFATGAAEVVIQLNMATGYEAAPVRIPIVEGGPFDANIVSGTLPWNASWDAEVQSEVQDAIEVNHLDHLLAVDYDPASKPGVATALLNELIGSDAGVSQFTANALELGTGGGGSSDVLTIEGVDATDTIDARVAAQLAAIHLDHLFASAAPGGGVPANSSFWSTLVSKSATPTYTTYNNTTDSLEAIRDNSTAAASAGETLLWEETTVASTISSTVFTLTTGPGNNNSLRGALVVIYDTDGLDEPYQGRVISYTGSTKTVRLNTVPTFAIENGDRVKLLPTAD